jgi:hypothetical protein
MRLIAHEIMERNACLLAIRLHDNGRYFGYMTHLGRAVKACVVLSLAELKNGLNVLLLGDNQVLALQMKRRFHENSNGTTFTTPAAVS